MKNWIAGLSTRLVAATALVAAITIGGCSESTTPTVSRGVAPSAGGRPDLTPAPIFSGFRSTTFTLTAAGGDYDIGGLFSVSFPANSVCDPDVSSYGPGTWDSSCATLADGKSVTVTATYGYAANGVPVVDFSPALRFSPNSNVVLSSTAFAPLLTTYRSYFLGNPSALRNFGMYYTPDLGASSYTDAGNDATLKTHVNLTTGIVWRRVKHFSGYSVTSGLPCDPSPDDPDCIDDGGPDISK